MQAGFVEQENRVLVAFFRLDEKDKGEREKPLKALASTFELDPHPWTPIIGDPNAEIVAVRLVIDRVATLSVPVVETLGNIEGGGIQFDRARFFRTAGLARSCPE